MSNTPPPLLTIPEAAEALRVSPKTIYRMINAGDLDTVDIAPSRCRTPRTRIPRTAIDRFIEARTRNSRNLRTA